MIHHGDMLVVLPTLDADSLDACITDPPYELGFMAKAWDGTGIAYNPQTWREILRVLKPGAHLLAFGGTRTYHRMTCAIEDAGFEIRDSLMWLYGTGFPKSLNVSKAIDAAAGAERESTGPKVYPGGHIQNHGGGKQGYHEWKAEGILEGDAPATDDAKAWDGWGTALKPAYEPIVLARKPMKGTVAANVLRFGTGALNIGATRIETLDDVHTPQSNPANRVGIVGSEMQATSDTERNQQAQRESVQRTIDLGRWPSNVLLDEEAAALLDEQSGGLRARGNVTPTKRNQSSGVVNFGGYQGVDGPVDAGDFGGASRFFYTSKPSREERDYGCEKLVKRTVIETVDRDPESAGVQNPRAGAGRGAGTPVYRCSQCGLHLGGGRAATECPNGVWGIGAHLPQLVGVTAAVRNHHPTVKPVALMRYLIKLIVPPDGSVLDPFMGSGTTGMACRYEHRKFVGIEMEAEYVEIAKARIGAVAPLFAMLDE